MLTKRCLGYPRWYGHSSQFQELHAINLLKIRNFTKTGRKQYFSNCKRLLRKTVGIFWVKLTMRAIQCLRRAHKKTHPKVRFSFAGTRLRYFAAAGCA
jgi:hypothetical protein